MKLGIVERQLRILRNVQKKRDARAKFFFFANISLLLFCRSRCRRRLCCLSSILHDPEILLPW